MVSRGGKPSEGITLLPPLPFLAIFTAQAQHLTIHRSSFTYLQLWTQLWSLTSTSLTSLTSFATVARVVREAKEVGFVVILDGQEGHALYAGVLVSARNLSGSINSGCIWLRAPFCQAGGRRGETWRLLRGNNLAYRWSYTCPI